MKTRQKALVAGSFTCVDCGRVHASNEVDHDKPLEQGGSNDQSNLVVRCVDCHKAKTKREAQARARG
ncbi:HNH endonuclease [Diaphorobacter sp. HDW4B]|uniref:HNH endonuclease n=1 Tax=Diaphorobacter sp. HDW4B TaxID=2714925 RepID=UPI0014080B27|nr:HNH endonuclease [Diaphorobacter sp. HDW4B]QIL73646.1 HNH endonuclease [Diaphorobacter sp. HDW4B]